jgi:predicted dehydrogenase
LRRYTDIFLSLKKVIQERKLGAIESIHVTYSKGLVENGSHYVDLVFFLLGDPTSYKISFVLLDEKHENPSFGLIFPGMPSVMFSGLNVPYHSMDIALTCENGRATVMYGGLKGRWEIKREQELFPGNFRLCEKEDSFLGPGGFKYAMLRELDDLINSYEHDLQPVSSLENSANVLNVLESVWQKIS